MQVCFHMAAKHTKYYNLELHALPFKTQQNPIYNQSPSPTSDHAFPILAIALLSIMATAILLFGYYVFVNKCCFNWQQVNLLRWVSTWRVRRNEDSFIALSPTMWNRGLDESVIRGIPAFQYRRGEAQQRSIYGCVVCLNEFQEEDMLRVLPNCNHSFHLDCIDIWLQSNANCPLCRTGISGITRYPIDQIIAPSSSPQGSQPYTDSLMGGDEDFVVIELGGEEEGILLPHRQQERDASRETQMQLRSQSPAKMEQKPGKLKPRKRHHLSIMGDECIDVREKDDQFSIQPIRRSFSLDSAVDRQLYLSVQNIIQQNTHQRGIYTSEESSNRVQTSFFHFGHSVGSRKAFLPI
ncbi:RING-H2 finger protein ATL16 [Ricinus communis]|uniref:RING-H2 finger protein ATL16 n=1 Tax=Ricinus communis TaxID=3988 RepID=UPI00201A8E14|nr:RING-H2 finger protein ATL16 [Ricinus communis]